MLKETQRIKSNIGKMYDEIKRRRAWRFQTVRDHLQLLISMFIQLQSNPDSTNFYKNAFAKKNLVQLNVDSYRFETHVLPWRYVSWQGLNDGSIKELSRHPNALSNQLLLFRQIDDVYNEWFIHIQWKCRLPVKTRELLSTYMIKDLCDIVEWYVVDRTYHPSYFINKAKSNKQPTRRMRRQIRETKTSEYSTYK